jgi:hypothetical protein
MITRIAAFGIASTVALGIAAAQRPSPPAEASTTINGKKITIKYSAPSVRGRQIWGDGGIISKDPNYPVWRAGANSATSLVTEGDLDINGLKVPKGSYTVYVLLSQPNWKLIVNKQTGQWGLEYHQDRDLGRVDMTMSKPSAPVETFKITLDSTGGNKGKLTMEWADTVASVPFTVQ